ncbi:MAG: CHAT domain-containing protein [Pseudomonadota bacterium]
MVIADAAILLVVALLGSGANSVGFQGIVSLEQASSHQIELDRAGFWTIVVHQHGADLKASLSMADGTELQADTPGHETFPERLTIHSPDSSQRLVLQLRAVPRGYINGAYAVALLYRGDERDDEVDADLALSAANNAYASLEFAEARRLYDELVQARPDAPSILLGAAELADRFGDKKRALMLTQRARAEVDLTLAEQCLIEAFETRIQRDLGSSSEPAIEGCLADPSIDRHPRLKAYALNNLALNHHRRGKLDEAAELYGDALALYEQIGDLSLQAVLSNNIGGIHYVRAEPEAAIDWFDRGSDLAAKARDDAIAADILGTTAQLRRSMGDFRGQVKDHLRELSIREEAADFQGEARALQRLGSAYREIGAAERAENFLRESLRLRRDLSDRRGIVESTLTLHDLRLSEHEQVSFAAALRNALLAATLSEPELLTRALMTLSRVSSRLGQAPSSILRMAGQRFAYGVALVSVQSAAEHQRPGAQVLVANSAASIGLPVTARLAAGKAIDLARGAGRKPDVLKAMHALAELEHRDGNNGASAALLLEALEMAREMLTSIGTPSNRTEFERVVRPLLSSFLRVTAPSDNGAAGLAQLEMTRAAIYGSWRRDLELNAADENDRTRLLRQLRFLRKTAPAATTRESRLLAELDAIASASPEPIAPVDLRSLASSLDEKTALVTYFFHENVLHRWTITKFESRYTRSNLDEANISDFARGIAERSLGMNEIAHRAQLLGEQMLASSAPLSEVERLIVVADSVLHELPFEALRWKSRWVVEHVELAYAPTLSILLKGTEARPPTGTAVVFASPDYPDRSLDLPLARLEAAAIREASSEAAALHLREDATSQRLLAYRGHQLPLLHLAIHGRADARHPELSELLFADGALTLTDFSSLRPAPAIVVLTACESRSGRASAIGFLGPTHGFLSAGSTAVVSARWKVPDRVGLAFSQLFYEDWRGALEEPISMVARAQQGLATDPRFRHPHYWANFAVSVGSR